MATLVVLHTLAGTSNAYAFPQAVPEVAGGEPTRESRAISDDPGTDAHLVASVRTFNGVWPTHGTITTLFGEVDRFSPRGHSGLDIAAPKDTPIVAADGGEVLKAYWNGDGYGGLIIVAHPSGYETWYAHLERFAVEQGQAVSVGQEIGRMGSTGLSTGSHLHFEIRENGQPRDPLTFLDPAKLQPASE